MENIQENQLLNVDRTHCYQNLYLWEWNHSNSLKAHTLPGHPAKISFRYSDSLFQTFACNFIQEAGYSNKLWQTQLRSASDVKIKVVREVSHMANACTASNAQHNQPLSDLLHDTEIEAKCLEVFGKSVKFS